MNHPLLELQDLSKHFGAHGGDVNRAVDGVNLSMVRGEVLGLVGESGCGKSTLGRLIVQLLQPTIGRVLVDGNDLSALSKRQLRSIRKKVQIVFQDPYGSLNPRMTIGRIIGEPLREHGIVQGGRAIESRAQELMERVGLDPDMLRRYPHEFSGGQRQRIGIARALAVEPELLVCDEPVSALDVSVQAQIINLLGSLQRELSLTILFIAHDLAVVRHISQRIAVMYLGKIVELGPADEVCTTPSHPYTRLLVSSIPVPDPLIERERQRSAHLGEVGREANRPTGCCYHPRCAYAHETCTHSVPALQPIEEGRRQVVCDRIGMITQE